MKKMVSACLILFTLLVSLNYNTFAQKNEWVNQVIVVNGGKYESGSPSDYVTVQSYNPVTQVTNIFGTIYTQSTQHAIINDNFLYVAAQDSIIKYNIDTYQRVAAIADSGLSKLYLYNNRLIVTKQWPIKRFFAEVLDANDLSLITRIQNISGDCGEVTVAQDTVYIAVNGGYTGTTGKLAVINTENWSLRREIELGPDAKGIWNLYNYSGLLVGVCRTPSGSAENSYLTFFDYFTGVFANVPFGITLSDGYGIKDDLLYLNINKGIGTINVMTKNIQDTVVIPDPGSQLKIFISSAAIDYINGNIYRNIGNMINSGRGVISNAVGDSIGWYPTGINADAIAIDYRTPVGISGQQGHSDLSVYPNPVNDYLLVDYSGQGEITGIVLSDLAGRIFSTPCDITPNRTRINCSDLKPGIYFLTTRTTTGNITRKFIKQ
ncbi:MAG: T9SS type A sorting domain-containing protein [bacterium]